MQGIAVRQKEDEIYCKIQDDEGSQQPDDLSFHADRYAVGKCIERFPKQCHADGQKQSPDERLAYTDTAAELESVIAVVPERVIQSSGESHSDKKFQHSRGDHDENKVEKI